MQLGFGLHGDKKEKIKDIFDKNFCKVRETM